MSYIVFERFQSLLPDLPLEPDDEDRLSFDRVSLVFSVFLVRDLGLGLLTG